MVLVEVDAIGAQRLQRGVDGLLEVLGAPVERPAAVGVAQVAALGGDQDVVAVDALQGLGDQALAMTDVRAVLGVGVGGVDQRHAGIDRGVDRADGLILVGPAGQREGHLAEADGKDLGVAEGAGGSVGGAHTHGAARSLRAQTPLRLVGREV